MLVPLPLVPPVAAAVQPAPRFTTSPASPRTGSSLDSSDRLSRPEPSSSSLSEPVPPSARRKSSVETRSVSLPAPPRMESAPPLPVSVSLPVPPTKISAVALPVSVSSPGVPRCATALVKEELAPQASGRSTDLTKEPEPSWMIGIRNLDAMGRSGPPEFTTACRQVLRKVSFWQFCDVANYVKVGSFPRRAGH